MIKNITELRGKTGAGIMACKEALEKCNCDIEQSILYLRKKGEIEKEKRSQKTAQEGTVGFYVHLGDQVAAMVELNSETDFVARNQKFKDFAHELAMQVVASNPKYINRSDVPDDEIEREKSAVSAGTEGKPEHIVEKMIAGRLEKFYKDICLMDQPYVKDPKITIKDLFDNLCIEFKEKMIIKRFCRFQVGN